MMGGALVAVVVSASLHHVHLEEFVTLGTPNAPDAKIQAEAGSMGMVEHIIIPDDAKHEEPFVDGGVEQSIDLLLRQGFWSASRACNVIPSSDVILWDGAIGNPFRQVVVRAPESFIRDNEASSISLATCWAGAEVSDFEGNLSELSCSDCWRRSAFVGHNTDVRSYLRFADFSGVGDRASGLPQGHDQSYQAAERDDGGSQSQPEQRLGPIRHVRLGLQILVAMILGYVAVQLGHKAVVDGGGRHVGDAAAAGYLAGGAACLVALFLVLAFPFIL